MSLKVLLSNSWRSILFPLLFLPCAICSGQPKAEIRQPAPLNPAEAARQGQALVTDLLAQQPEATTNTGMLKLRDAEGKERQMPVKFEISPEPGGWRCVYEFLGADGEKLAVSHSGGRPNRYVLSRPASAAATNSGPRELAGNQTMLPFAGSDFWVADLGLEFLHWPQQLLLKKEMRRGQSCNVLESVNPQRVSGAYSRVVSWIDIESGGIVHADAYDSHRELLKQFDPKEFKKVHGQWQLQEMEIRNRQTGSRTRIEFDLKAGEPG